MKKEFLFFADYYRDHITNDIMPFWDSRCLDLTCFDREGNLTDDNKYIWFQGRQLYVYALLYNNIERRSEWLTYAEHGYKFLINKAYAGNGRWNYKLNRQGDVLVGTNSIFSDFHVLHGLAEYMKAIDCKDERGMQIVRESYDTMEKNMYDSEFKDIYENTWSPIYIWHDMYLTCLATAEACTDVLGAQRTKKLIGECLDKILYWFAQDDYKVIFECVTRDRKVDVTTPKGRFVNPGHMLESMWFCLHEGKRRNDRRIIDRAIEITRWGNRVGEDREHGGLFSYVDAVGLEPEPIDWFKETNSMWDEKVWWSNAEALCCYAYAFSLGGDREFYEMFKRQHEFCRTYFYDDQYGEWFERLERDGTVKNSSKGTPWKCAFHLVRALVMIEGVFRELAGNES